jgi:hypothetical protein
MKDLNLNITEEQARSISVIKDPFATEHITNVMISYNNNGYTNPYWYGRVVFTNGKTSGEQKTNDVQSFEEIVVEIRQILNSLNHK